MTAIQNTYSFGYWIRRRRKALDLTQADLARLVGCSLQTVKKIEMDERRPSVLMAERLADCLEVPAQEKEMFIKVARQKYSPERITQKNKLFAKQTMTVKEWVSRLEGKIENAIEDMGLHKHDLPEPEDDPSQDPDFGV